MSQLSTSWPARPQYWTLSIGLVLCIYFALVGSNSFAATQQIGLAQTCTGFPMSAGTETELNTAIGCFNTAPAGDYEINVTADIILSAKTSSIQNGTAARLIINGNNHTIDGGGNGRVMNVQDGDVTISQLTLQQGDAARGSGIFIGSPAVVTLTQTSVISNVASSDGGGIFNNGMLTINNSTVSGNRVTSGFRNGGGIANLAGTLMISDSTISNNSSDLGSGGGIINNDGGTVTINSSTISENASSLGGGGVYNDNGTAMVDGSNIVDNSTDNGGGGVLNGEDGELIVSNSQILRNTASTNGGGIRNSGIFSISTSDIADNMAVSGGGIADVFFSTANLGESPTSNTVSNSRVTNNSATDQGGGIFTQFSIPLLLDHSTVDGNSATTGGGLALISEALIQDSTISGNTASDSAGGIFQSNKTVINSSTIYDNSSNRGGGIANSSAFVAGSLNSELTINNSTISGNVANNLGGGILNNSRSTVNQPLNIVTVNNSTIYGNSANNSGGGVFNGVATMTFNNSIIASSPLGGDCAETPDNPDGSLLTADPNNLDSDGSCDNATQSNSLNLSPLQDNGGPTLTHALLGGSDAIDAAAVDPEITTDQRGVARPQSSAPDVGAFEAETGSSCSLVSFMVSSEAELNSAINCFNTAPTGEYSINVTADITLSANTKAINNPNGASLMLNGNNFTIDGDGQGRIMTIRGGNATISQLVMQNGAAENGGGVLVGSTAVVTLTQSTVISNSADLGGGVYNNGTLVINDSDISENTSNLRGGGIYNNDYNEVIISDSTISDNASQGAGGGLFNAPLSVVMLKNSFVFGNSAASGSGGGIHNSSRSNDRFRGGDLSIDQTSIFNNSAANFGGGVFSSIDSLLSVTNSQIYNNTADIHGGGIYLNQLRNTISNSDIYNNSASENGGGLYISFSYETTIDNSNIYGNSAAFGGGVYNIFASSLVINDSSIYDNVAEQDGGGVNNQSTVFINGSTIFSNSAGNQGGGLHNDRQAAVKNSTFSDNTALAGGGIASSHLALVSNSTIFENSGGGVIGTTTLTNSIIANSTNGDDCSATVSADSANLDSDGSCDSAVQSTNINLGPLQDNGGPTLTHALPEGSDAVDAATFDSEITTDQRGIVRPQGSAPDIGAYELEAEFACPTFPITVNSEIVLNIAISCYNEAPAGEYTIDIQADVLLTANTVPIENSTAASLTINGNNHTIDGSGNGRVLNIQDSDVTVSDLTIKSGVADAIPCSFDTGRCGGGVFIGSSATVTLSRATLIDNSAERGGGIYAKDGSVTVISDSTISGNSADEGGGIANFGLGKMTIIDSIISNNTAQINGGGISNSSGGMMTVSRTTMNENSALNDEGTGFGGGVANTASDLTIRESTIFGNQADGGAGSFNSGSGLMIIENSTLTENSAPFGSTLLNFDGATITIRSSTIAGNRTDEGEVRAIYNFSGNEVTLINTLVADNCTGVIADGNNIDADGSCDNATTKSLAEINLGSLKDNGGSTETMALLSGSAAVDAAALDPNIAFDQRGASRPQGAAPDVGAYETTCASFPVNVSNETELNQAIDCFNIEESGDFEIRLTANILLTASTNPINNGTAAELIIVGNNLTIDGDEKGRIFNVQDGNVTISELTIQRGEEENGGGVYIESTADVTLSLVKAINNKAINDGGAIFSRGTITVDQSTIAENEARNGGGVYNETNGNALIRNSTFYGNVASVGFGGGIYNAGGDAEISNSTISGNFAENDGGGVYNSSNFFVMTNSTVVENIADYSIGGLGDDRESLKSISNSIVANNTNGPGCTNEVIGDCAGRFERPNLMLGPLQNNGGPTLTHALLPGSSAIDAGNNAICAADPINNLDQRGVIRPQGAACDLGAFEFSEDGQPNTAEITIVVDTTPFTNRTNFQFFGDLGVFRLDNAGGDDGDPYTNSQTFEVPSGTYKVTEQEFSRWNLLDLTCNTDNVVIELDKMRMSLTVNAGDSVTCTFLNERAAFINARKVDDQNGNSNYNTGEPFLPGWTIEVYDSNRALVDSQATNGEGRVSFKVLAGDYTVCEVEQDYWTATRPVMHPTFNQPCYEVSVAPRQVGWMRFFNTQQPPAGRTLFVEDTNDVMYTWLPESNDINPGSKPAMLDPFDAVYRIYLPYIGR